MEFIWSGNLSLCARTAVAGGLWRVTLIERQLAAILVAAVAGYQRQTRTESNNNDKGR
jgi:hypothetical protein